MAWGPSSETPVFFVFHVEEVYWDARDKEERERKREKE